MAIAVVLWVAWLIVVFFGYLVLAIFGKAVKGTYNVSTRAKSNTKQDREHEYNTLWKKKFKDEFGTEAPQFGSGFFHQLNRLVEIQKEAKIEAAQYKAEKLRRQKEQERARKMERKAARKGF